MGLIALFIGIVLIVSAVRNSQGALFTALEADVPKFVVWGAAIIAVGAIGAIPGLKPISRWLLALVIVVIIVNNYQKLVAGFQAAVQQVPTQTATASSSSTAAPVTSGNTSAVSSASNPFGIQLGSGGSILSGVAQ